MSAFVVEMIESCNADTAVVGGDLAKDSLEFLAIATRIAEFFRLDDHGVADLLLTARTIGELRDTVYQYWSPEFGICVQTSGTTGIPKRTVHYIRDLMREADQWLTELPWPAKIHNAMPPHHLYGFIFSVLIPSAIAKKVKNTPDVTDGITIPKQALVDVTAYNANEPWLWVVANPTVYKTWLRLGIDFAPITVLISSTEPMDHDTAEGLRGTHAASVIDIYGASEFGGIAWRDILQNTAFRFLNDVSYDPVKTVLKRGMRSHESLDLIRMKNPGDPTCREFELCGRTDGAIQIAGQNSYPKETERFLRRLPFVADASVDLVNLNSMELCLAAHVIPLDDMPLTELQQRLEDSVAEGLPPSLHPARWTFGVLRLPNSSHSKSRTTSSNAARDIR